MSDGGKGDKRRPEDSEAFSEGFDRIFGKSKPKRGRFIWDAQKQEFIPIEEYVAPPPVDAPMVMGDIPPYKSMVDGSMIGGRKQHREHLKQHGLIEVGNETKHLKPYGNYKPQGIKQDLVREMQRYKETHRR